MAQVTACMKISFTRCCTCFSVQAGGSWRSRAALSFRAPPVQLKRRVQILRRSVAMYSGVRLAALR